MYKALDVFVRGLVLAVLVAASPARAAIDRLVIFGDSLSDVGNVDNASGGISPGSGYFDGRYSNGPVWVEALAAELGAPVPEPRRTGLFGTNSSAFNYAHGGATTADGTAVFGIIWNIGSQVSRYTSSFNSTANQLMVLWGGANDFFDGQTNASVPVNNLAGDITALANDGAAQFLVPNLPPLGQTPDFRGTADEASMDALTVQFNTQLDAALDGLETSLGVTIHRFDVFGLFQDLLADPAAFGFANVTDPAMSSGPGGGVVAQPDAYLFWDGVHPTAAAHAMLGQLAADVLLPGPVSIPGDADGDGDVDADDLAVVSANYGMAVSGGAADGDLNGDGIVNLDDYSLFALNFGAVADVAPGAIPEPALCSIIGMLGLLHLRTRSAG